MKRFAICVLALALLVSGGALAEISNYDLGWDAPDYSFSYVLLEDGTAELTDIGSQATVIPHAVEGHTVTSIGDRALANTRITDIDIPDTVTHLGTSILGSHRVRSITIPDSVRQIDGNLFDVDAVQYGLGKSLIPELYVSPTNEYIAELDGALYAKKEKHLIYYPPRLSWDSRIGEVVIPEGIRSIGSYAFANSSIANLYLPSTLVSMDEHAFSNSFITYIHNEGAQTEISDYCFEGCEELVAFSIPATVTSIGEGAFRNCVKLEALLCEGTFASIGDYAFENCAQLKRFDISEGITSIGVDTFKGCVSLSWVSIPSSLQEPMDTNPFAGSNNISINVTDDHPRFATLGGILCDKIEKKIITFPYLKATSFEVPDGITAIGSLAFAGCAQIGSVKIPASVVYIAADAFEGCRNLTLRVLPGTYGEAYAKQYGISYDYERNDDWLFAD